MMKNTKGITLVALVITIIILLILAGVGIQAITQTNLFYKAKQSKNATENAQREENEILDDYENKINISTNGLTRENNTKSIIKVYLDGNEIEDLPNKNLGYMVIEISCTNGATAKYDYSNGTIQITNISTKDTECTIKFSSKSIFTEIKQNLGNIEKLEKMFNTPGFVSKAFEVQNARELMYENYNIIEPILANSDTAFNELKNFSQCILVSKSGRYKNFYDGKAFVLGFSCSGDSYGNYSAENFLSGNFYWNPSGYYSNTGLDYKVNKFAPNININGIWGTSINWDNQMYVKFIKI